MQHRVVSFLLFAVVAASGAIALVSWYRTSPVVQMPVAEAAVPEPVSREMPAAAVQIANPVPAASAPTPDTVAQWISDTASADAQKRAAAITALAEAPRADALPVLRRLVTDGEPQVDRRLALNSLRELGLSQGDADGRIRDAVRHAIYHGDDMTPTSEAQEVLDILEESEMK